MTLHASPVSYEAAVDLLEGSSDELCLGSLKIFTSKLPDGRSAIVVLNELDSTGDSAVITA